LKIADFGLARAAGIPVKNYTHEVVTLWYRPPDVLLGSKNYSTSIDIWSVGCIFAELVNLKALFKGENEQDELNLIFQVVGTPHIADWPELKNLDKWTVCSSLILHSQSDIKVHPSQDLAKIVPTLDEQGVDLLSVSRFVSEALENAASQP